MKWESNEVIFQLLSDDNPVQEASAGDLLILLQPSDVHVTPEGQSTYIEGGYHMIADIMQKRHSKDPRQSWASELGDLFEGILCNSDWKWVPGDTETALPNAPVWKWVPGDTEMALSNSSHMYIDDHGDLQILLRYWQFDCQVFEDPIEELFTKGYIVFTGHDNEPDLDTPDYLLDLFRGSSPHFEDAWRVWEMAGKPTFEGLVTRDL